MGTPYINPLLEEAKKSAELGVSSINWLHLGPLDYNIAETIDCFLKAIRLLEQFKDENC